LERAALVTSNSRRRIIGSELQSIAGPAPYRDREDLQNAGGSPSELRVVANCFTLFAVRTQLKPGRVSEVTTMSGTEIFQAIQKLPFSEQRALAEQLQQALSAAEALTADAADQREREFELEMLTEGFFAHIPTRTMTDEKFDEYEPPEIEGEPLSEQIIRERIWGWPRADA
jgi:hypothetical protein